MNECGRHTFHHKINIMRGKSCYCPLGPLPHLFMYFLPCRSLFCSLDHPLPPSPFLSLTYTLAQRHTHRHSRKPKHTDTHTYTPVTLPHSRQASLGLHFLPLKHTPMRYDPEIINLLHASNTPFLPMLSLPLTPTQTFIHGRPLPPHPSVIGATGWAGTAPLQPSKCGNN